MRASIVIRTYNEQRYLPRLLRAIHTQSTQGLDYEVIVVDSGSTDKTLELAKDYRCKIVHIAKSEFSFGRSLNLGCAAARGDCLVFISGHCVPVNDEWLVRLVAPLVEGQVAMTYGRQIGGETTRFSEHQIFSKFYPKNSQTPQKGYFCNNANSALLQSVWSTYRFNESLTGLEDMYLGKQLTEVGIKLGYVAEAMVYHYHHESWATVQRRYEREAIALQYIMPEIHVSFADFLRYLSSALLLDMGCALQQKQLWQLSKEIFLFRFMQFWGTYRGNHNHRQLSRKRKETYFYPRQTEVL